MSTGGTVRDSRRRAEGAEIQKRYYLGGLPRESGSDGGAGGLFVGKRVGLEVLLC